MKRNRILFLIIAVVISQNLYAQIGINTTNPDSSAALHIVGAEKGVLFPEMNEASRRRVVLGGLEVGDGLLAYDPVQKVLYIRNTAIKEWSVLNPFRIGHDNNGKYTHIRLVEQFAHDSIYIGTALNKRAEAKLHIDGDFKANVVKATELKLPFSLFDAGITIDGFNEMPFNVKTVSIGATESNVNNVTVTGFLTVQSYELDGLSVITGDKIVAGNGFEGPGTIPVGGIIMWSGATPPEGWALCNGQTANDIATPDLSGRFIVGIGKNQTPNGRETENPIYNINDKGGVNKYSLSVDEMPAHSHSSQFGTNGWDRAGSIGLVKPDGGDTKGPYDITSSTMGLSYAHESRPPYYALAFIMRIK